MTKQQFLNELNRLLVPLPDEERKDILSDYESHIDSAIKNGKSEEEAVKDLGSPRTIAFELGTPIEKTDTADLISQKETTNRSVGPNIFAFLGMLLFNLIFIVGPALGIAGVFIGLYAASIGFLVTPLGFIMNLFTHDTPILLMFFVVLAAFSFGYLLLWLTNFLAKGYIRLLYWYWKLNVKIVNGGY
ncbi:HAAS signaling domain-containing protein [Ectobacillus polymachus]|uniref:HAAS signaling domain-containing protein n=1 Tax=Ectobacillus polymachus TaxID=1508806 RepID=UPI003A8B1738